MPAHDDSQRKIAQFIERAYGMLPTTDYYAILGVDRAAGGAQIRDSYYKLAVRLHPDRFGDWMDRELRRKLTAVYSRVGEAYKILTHGERREQYDAGLAEGRLRWDVDASKPKVKRPEDLVSNPAARRFFLLGREALATKNGKSAVMNLQMALSMEPGNAAIQEALVEAKKLAAEQEA